MMTNFDEDCSYPALSETQYKPSPALTSFEFVRTAYFVATHDDYFQDCLIACSAFALFSSSASSIFSMYFRHERVVKSCMELNDLDYNPDGSKGLVDGPRRIIRFCHRRLQVSDCFLAPCLYCLSCGSLERIYDNLSRHSG